MISSNFFSKRKDWDDILIILIGIIFLCVALYHLTTGQTFRMTRTENILRDFLFFNTLHVPMTFLFLFMLPEYKSWMIDRKSVFTKTSYEMVIAFILFFLFSYFGYKFGISAIPFNIKSNSYFYTLSIILMLWLTSYHNLGQIRGLSFLFVPRNRVESNRRQIINESFLYKFLLPTRTCFSVSVFFREYWNIEFFWFNLFYTSLFWLMCFFVVAVLVNCAFYDKSIRVKKFLFSLRLVIFCLTDMTPFAIFAVQANHGIEYMMISRRILNRSQATQLTKNKIYFFGFLILLGWCIVVVPRYYSFYSSIPQLGLSILLSLTMATDLLHYWIDRLIFRMRHSSSRQFILPLVSR